MSSSRLDRALVERGLVSTRTKAQRLIERGVVEVDGEAITKTSFSVSDDAAIVVTEPDMDVGRGALKLRAALERWPIPVVGADAVDLGASTGGFTQVLLESGASSVVAIDVGHGQLHPSMAEDPRVTSWEGQNILELTPELWRHKKFSEAITVVVADLSFVSLSAVVPTVVNLFGVHSHYTLLVKPQFEVGRSGIREGIVKNERLREQALRDVANTCGEAGIPVRAVMCSPITGEKGNVEYLLYASATSSLYPAEWDGQIPVLSPGE